MEINKEINKIANWIKKNYTRLPKSKIEGKELVIFATGDFGGEYGYGSSDLKSYGVDRDGRLFWAYASGCSCNCDAGTEERTIKLFQVNNLDGDTDILRAISLFKTDMAKFEESITSHEYTSW